MKTEITKGVEIGIKEGKAYLEADLKLLAVKPIEEVEAKVESGEIDIIKGTDIDKVVFLKVSALIKAQILA